MGILPLKLDANTNTMSFEVRCRPHSCVGDEILKRNSGKNKLGPTNHLLERLKTRQKRTLQDMISFGMILVAATVKMATTLVAAAAGVTAFWEGRASF